MAIKNGWSWSAFLFGSLWALCAQLWLIGIMLLPIELFLQMLTSIIDNIQRSASGSYEETTSMIGGVITLLFLLMRVGFGSFGNGWSRRRLVKTGYKLKQTINARNKENAISLTKASSA